MSALTLFADKSLTVPDYLLGGGMDDLTKSLAGGSNTHSISIKGGVFRMVVGSEEVARNEDRAMDIVIIGASPSVQRTFYAGQYEEGVFAVPDCYSSNNQTPDLKAPNKQHPTCNGCPQNIAGSGQNNSRACRFSRRLAVVLPHDMEGPAYRVSLPALSIFGKAEGDKMPLEAYAKFLAGHGLKVSAVVTEMRFDTTQAVPVLTFRAKRPLGPEEYASLQVRQGLPEIQELVAMTFPDPKKEGEAAAPAPAPAPAAAPAEAPKAARTKKETVAPAPQPEPAEEAAAAPVVRTAKPAQPEPTQAKSVMDVLNAWGTDDE